MLTLLLGTDWTANRDEILRKVAQDVSDKKSGRVLIVPELISHDTERRLCEAAGDTCSRFAEVLSFSQLANRVAESVGHAAPVCLDNGGRIVAVASAARQLHSRIKAYAKLETRPEFLVGLLDAIDEFKRCCITSNDLLLAAKETEGSLAQKLEELSLLLEAYDTLCSQGKCDPRDQMTWMLHELEDSDFASQRVFYIDGFPDFTRQHFSILMYLIRESPNVTISLTCDEPGSTLLAFEKAGQSAAELIREAERLGVPVNVQYVSPRSDDLQIVRERIFQGSIDARISNVKTYRGETVYQECSIAAERILQLVRDGNRYRDINVVCSDMQQYGNIIELVFTKCGIPVYLAGTEDILEKSAVKTVLSAMDAAFNGFTQQDVLKYLKTALSPIKPDLCDRIENYAIMWNIQGNDWLSDWRFHPGGLGENWNEIATQKLFELNTARVRVMDPLIKLRDGFQKARKVSQQVECLYGFLEEISISDKLRQLANRLEIDGDGRNAQILNQLWDILLSAMEQLHEVLGETSWDAENFTRLFRLLLSQYDVGTIPPVLDTVTVGPVSAMRCQQGKHLIVLGAQEGCLPGYGGSAGVLTDYERTELRRIGVQLTGGAMEGVQAEFAEIYGVFCGAEESITVGYTGTQPSFIFSRLSRFSNGVEQALRCAIGNNLDAAAVLLRTNAVDTVALLNLDTEWNTLCVRRTHKLGELSEENVKKLYGEKLVLSASQVDRQAECRLMYFLKYGIRAKERKVATIDPAEFGTYVHAVLEETAREVSECGGFRSVSMEETMAIARKHSEKYAMERFSEIDTERLNFLFQRNTQELEMIITELWKEMQISQFEPVGFEVGFGDARDISAIDVSGKKMQAELRGFVDRVDFWSDGNETYFRVVDYKTGKKDFDYCDIYNGYGLQMLLYLFALEENGCVLLGESRVPAGVQYFPARVPFVSADGCLSDEEAELEREKIWKRKGLILAQSNVLYAMENLDNPKRMPYSRRKDGELSGDIADRYQFAMLKAYVFFLVGKMVDDIASGNITPNPYTRGSSHNACQYCPYGMVCHKEAVEDRRDYKAITAQHFWEDIEKEMSNNV